MEDKTNSNILEFINWLAELQLAVAQHTPLVTQSAAIIVPRSLVKPSQVVVNVPACAGRVPNAIAAD